VTPIRYVVSTGNNTTLTKQSPPYVSTLKDKFLQAPPVPVKHIASVLSHSPKKITANVIAYCTFPFLCNLAPCVLLCFERSKIQYFVHIEAADVISCLAPLQRKTVDFISCLRVLQGSNWNVILKRKQFGLINGSRSLFRLINLPGTGFFHLCLGQFQLRPEFPVSDRNRSKNIEGPELLCKVQ